MAIDLKGLSPKELRALVADANAQMHEAHATEVQAVKQKIEVLLKSRGLTIDEVYPTRGKKAAGKKGSKSAVAPKYRNPADPSQTWSGRGRQPLWMAAALKRRGATLDDLLIGGAGKPPAPADGKGVAKKASKKTPKRGAKKAAAKKPA